MHRYLLSRLRARGRASAIFLSFLAVAIAPQSWGLGLGEIELDSALNQDFKATIELFDAAGVGSDEMDDGYHELDGTKKAATRFLEACGRLRHWARVSTDPQE